MGEGRSRGKGGGAAQQKGAPLPLAGTTVGRALAAGAPLGFPKPPAPMVPIPPLPAPLPPLQGTPH